MSWALCDDGRMVHPLTPARAWTSLREGNDRFVRGVMEHPCQDVGHRTELRAAQAPFAVVFGCSDSRVAAEIVFDRGLGDLFVVRTAGHVVDTTVLGSIEYGVQVLGAPLVLVLGHDACGAVEAAAEALSTGRMPEGFVRAIVDRVIPSIIRLADVGQDGADGWTAGKPDPGPGVPSLVVAPDALGRGHVRHTVRMLLGYSAALRDAVGTGRCAIIGATYALSEGKVELVESAGSIGD